MELKINSSKFLYRIVCSLVLMLCTATAQQSCKTAQGAYGQCVAVKQCKFVLDILVKYNNDLSLLPPQDLQNLQKSQCHTGQEGIFVCCETKYITSETPTNPTDKTTAITTVTAAPDFPSYEASLNANGVKVLKALNCGLESTYRVKNGDVAGLAEFAFMALLRYNSEENPFQCGGSLITTKFVMSAAHCIENKEVIGIRLGEHDLSMEPDCRRRTRALFCSGPVEDIGIEKITIHPQYNGKTVANDVSLIKMDRSVDFKQHIKPICLPITEPSYNSPDRYIIAGWGTTEKRHGSDILLKAVLDHQEISVCKNLFRRATIDERHICAGNTEKIVDSCRGDSGGPLFFQVQYENTPRYVQYGIVSFGVAQCDSKETYPGIYTNLKHFMPWITSNIE